MAQYLYNGIKLPGLPAYSTSVYPFAYIVEIQDNTALLVGKYMLFLVGGSPAYAYSTDEFQQSSGVIAFSEGAVFVSYRVVNGVWTEMNRDDSTAEGGVYVLKPGAFVPVWSNFGIRKADGNLYLAASQPEKVGICQRDAFLRGLCCGFCGDGGGSGVQTAGVMPIGDKRSFLAGYFTAQALVRGR